MKLTWYAHACFRIDLPDTSIVTDPYRPEHARLAPVPDPADFVVMSSDDDPAHSAYEAVPGAPIVYDALRLARGEADPPETFELRSFRGEEGVEHRAVRATSAYKLELDVSVCHLGDLGRMPSVAALASLEPPVDVLLALAGGPPTLPLGDLAKVIDVLEPRLVIPMHYATPKVRYELGGLDAFLQSQQGAPVLQAEGSTITVEAGALPAERTIAVLAPLLG